MADEEEVALARDPNERHRVKITSKAPGPRMVITARGGQTVQPGGSITATMTENEFKAIKPYVELGHFILSQPDAEDEKALKSQDILPQQAARAVDAQLNAVDDVDHGGPPTNVQHRGFGRFFGMRGDEVITEAMNKVQALEYANEHDVPMGAALNEAGAGDKTGEGEET